MNNFVYTKKCNKCGEEKMLSEMMFSKGRPVPLCRYCQSKNNKRYAENSELGRLRNYEKPMGKQKKTISFKGWKE
jgi:hypothetical protein